MTKPEKIFFNFIQKHISIILILAVTAFGLLIRYCGMDFESDDYQGFLKIWWDIIDSEGKKSLAYQIGNYNIPYQIIIYLLTLLPIGPLHSYKLVSIIFDVVLAFSAGLLVYSLGNKSKFKAVLTYALTFCSLTVIFNSSFWAQCDSIYVSFILFAIYFLLKDKNILSFVMLGIAFAFKLQTVFIFPVFIFYYIATRKISILHFLIIPITDVIMCMPALIFGRNPLDLISIYVEQTDYGKLIQMNCPNIYAFMCEGNDMTYYYLFKNMSILLTVVILGIALCMIIYKKVDLSDTNKFLLTSIWTVFTCIMFLSSMHERYSYLLDILLIVFVLLTAKHYWVAVVCNLVSLRGYCYYLFGFYKVLDLKVTAIIYIAVYAYVTYIFVKDVVMSSTQLNRVSSHIKHFH